MGAANHLAFAELYLCTYDRYFDYLQGVTGKLGKPGIRVPEHLNIPDNPDTAWRTCSKQERTARSSVSESVTFHHVSAAFDQWFGNVKVWNAEPVTK